MPRWPVADAYGQRRQGSWGGHNGDAPARPCVGLQTMREHPHDVAKVLLANMLVGRERVREGRQLTGARHVAASQYARGDWWIRIQRARVRTHDPQSVQLRRPPGINEHRNAQRTGQR